MEIREQEAFWEFRKVDMFGMQGQCQESEVAGEHGQS